MNLQRFAQEKTEEPTEKKKRDARAKGQVFKSTELNSALTLMAASLVLVQVGAWSYAGLFEGSTYAWSQLGRADLTLGGVQDMAAQWFSIMVRAVGPIAGAVLAMGLLANLLQVGGVFSLHPLSPNAERINPIKGLQKIFSRRSVFEAAKSLTKLLIVAAVAYFTLREEFLYYPNLVVVPLDESVAMVASAAARVFSRCALALLVLSGADFFYQRYEYLQGLRMTKQEVRDEHKQTEGSPEVRQRIRRKQREIAHQRMLADVAKADVVITNPTHYAVALRYDNASMEAPAVLAKGVDHVAERIKALAKEYNVPQVENRYLARTLWATVEVGHSIPADLYRAVAEVLAHVYRTRQRGGEA